MKVSGGKKTGMDRRKAKREARQKALSGDEPQAQASGLWDLQAGSSHPQSQLPAFRRQSISWQKKREARDRRQAIGRGRGHKGRGPWEGEGSYANSRIHGIPTH
jgi:hypothetical protein